MSDLREQLVKMVGEELALNHDGDDATMRCACPDCAGDLVDAMLAKIASRQSATLRDAFQGLLDALYWALIPSNLERALVSDRLHRMHVAVHAGVPPIPERRKPQ